MMTLTFFFYLDLTYFPTNFKGDMCFLAIMTSVSILDWVYVSNTHLFENGVIIEQIKPKFYWENKVYARKESSPTKYFCIRRTLTVFSKSFTLNLCLYDIVHYAPHRTTEETKWKNVELSYLPFCSWGKLHVYIIFFIINQHCWSSYSNYQYIRIILVCFYSWILRTHRRLIKRSNKQSEIKI